MPNLSGRYYHAIDAKSRLTIPARLRDAINPKEEGYGFVATVTFDNVLYLYTPRTYEAIAPEFDVSSQANPDVRNYQRVVYGLSEDLEMDRMGRVLIPDHLMNECGFLKEVVVVGVKDHIEVWPRDKWDTFVQEQKAGLEELAKRVLAHGAKAPQTPPADGDASI